MSIRFPTIDLSTVSVGQVVKILLGKETTVVNPSFSKDKPHLQVFNESGVGLNYGTVLGKDTQFIPAGAWPVYEMIANETEIDFSVEYIIPNAPVKSLIVIYYQPGEPVPPTPILGNSPVGVGGSVSTSGSTLSNEGNAAPLLVIDLGDTAFNQLVTIFNDGHVTWSVDNAGVKVPLMHWDTVGDFIFDTAKGITVGLVNTPVDNTSWAAVSGTAGVIDTRIQASHLVRLQVPGGTDIITAGATSVTVNQDTTFVGNVSLNAGKTITANTIILQNGSFNRASTGTASVGATSTVVINHGMNAAPAQVLVTTDQSGSSGTNSAFSYTSTQFSLFNGAGATLVYRWWASG